MKHLFILVALTLGITATFAQVDEATLRSLEALEKEQSSTKNGAVIIRGNGADTLKIVADKKVYTFIDSISANNPNKKLLVREDTTTNTLVIVLAEPDSSRAMKEDLTLHMDNITITHDSMEYIDMDTTIIRMGNRRIIFIHNDQKNLTTIEIPNKSKSYKYDDDDGYDDDNDNHSYSYSYEFDSDANQKKTVKTKRRVRYFTDGNWGPEFGFNGFMDANNSMVMKGDLDWMDLKQARSWNFNINFWNRSFGLGTRYVGLVTGMGFSFNNYHFSNPVTLKIENGITTVDSSFFGTSVRRTKLHTFGFDIPLMLEFHIPTGSYKTINISAGVIGEVRISSKTKVVYDRDGDKRKQRNGSDFNMTTLKYYLTARVGFDDCYIFANYSPIRLFEESKGPEVYPFSIGIGWIMF